MQVSAQVHLPKLDRLEVIIVCAFYYHLKLKPPRLQNGYDLALEVWKHKLIHLSPANRNCLLWNTSCRYFLSVYQFSCRFFFSTHFIRCRADRFGFLFLLVLKLLHSKKEYFRNTHNHTVCFTQSTRVAFSLPMIFIIFSLVKNFFFFFLPKWNCQPPQKRSFAGYKYSAVVALVEEKRQNVPLNSNDVIYPLSSVALAKLLRMTHSNSQK